MVLTQDQLENALSFVIEHYAHGFIRINLEDAKGYRLTAKEDGDERLLTSHEEGRRVTDRFPVLPNMGS